MNSSQTYELDELVDSKDKQLKEYLIENKIKLFNDKIKWEFKPITYEYISDDEHLHIIFRPKFTPINLIEEIPNAIKIKFIISIDDEEDLDHYLEIQENVYNKIVELSMPVDPNNSQGNLEEVLNRYHQIRRVTIKLSTKRLEVFLLVTFNKINEDDNVCE